jgi:hypothetical protein
MASNRHDSRLLELQYATIEVAARALTSGQEINNSYDISLLTMKYMLVKAQTHKCHPARTLQQFVACLAGQTTKAAVLSMSLTETTMSQSGCTAHHGVHCGLLATRLNVQEKSSF